MLFEMLSQRYERASTLVTGNLLFAEWTEVLGPERSTGALLGHLTHHVHILEMNGERYRLKNSRRKGTRKVNRFFAPSRAKSAALPASQRYTRALHRESIGPSPTTDLVPFSSAHYILPAYRFITALGATRYSFPRWI
jgi:IstB-like ATP binding protein